MLVSGLVLLGTHYDGFFEIDGTSACTAKPESEAQKFINGGKVDLMKMAMLAHVICLVSHYMFQILNYYDQRVLANFFQMFKMMSFFVIILKIQNAIDFTECASITDNSMVMAWLTYEVLVFYLNIGSLSVFIFIQNFKKFRSIRDRLELSGDQRKTTDFLVYSRDDVPWWSAWFIQFSLSALSLVFRNKTSLDIKQSIIEVFGKHLLGAYLLRQLYYNSKFQFKAKTKTALVLTIFINFLLIFRFRELVKLQAHWWTPVVLIDIILYFVIFAQMAQEYMVWDKKVLAWRRDLAFDQQYRQKSDDESERVMRKNLDSIVETLESSAGIDKERMETELPIQEFNYSEKMNKDLKIAASIYSACYFLLIKKNK